MSSTPAQQHEASCLSNHATELLRSGHRSVALACLRRAQTMDATFEVRLNLAVALYDVGDISASEKILNQLRLEYPRSASVLHTLAILNVGRQDYETALELLGKACLLEPNNKLYTFSLSCAQLESKDLLGGFKNHESRLFLGPQRTFDTLVRWNGEANKKVYVWAEQGLGDALQFARYVPWVAAISERVTFSVPAGLRGLMAGYEQIATVVTDDQLDVDATHEIPLFSLPALAKTSWDTIPADPGFIPQTCGKLFGPPPKRDENFRVGLCWAAASTHVYAKDRTIPFDELVKLAGLPAFFFSLQVGPLAADVATNRAQRLVKDMSAMIEGDWLKTAALIRELDLVVTTDTSVAHLAAILGVPTWMMLQWRGEWRWPPGETSPWYPAMKIFRQERPGSWQQVIDKIYKELGELLLMRETP